MRPARRPGDHRKRLAEVALPGRRHASGGERVETGRPRALAHWLGAALGAFGVSAAAHGGQNLAVLGSAPWRRLFTSAIRPVQPV